MNTILSEVAQAAIAFIQSGRSLTSLLSTHPTRGGWLSGHLDGLTNEIPFSVLEELHDASLITLSHRSLLETHSLEESNWDLWRIEYALQTPGETQTEQQQQQQALEALALHLLTQTVGQGRPFTRQALRIYLNEEIVDVQRFCDGQAEEAARLTTDTREFEMCLALSLMLAHAATLAFFNEPDALDQAWRSADETGLSRSVVLSIALRHRWWLRHQQRRNVSLEDALLAVLRQTDDES